MIIKWDDKTIDLPEDRPIEILLHRNDNIGMKLHGNEHVLITLSKGDRKKPIEDIADTLFKFPFPLHMNPAFMPRKGKKVQEENEW